MNPARVTARLVPVLMFAVVWGGLIAFVVVSQRAAPATFEVIKEGEGASLTLIDVACLQRLIEGGKCHAPLTVSDCHSFSDVPPSSSGSTILSQIACEDAPQKDYLVFTTSDGHRHIVPRFDTVQRLVKTEDGQELTLLVPRNITRFLWHSTRSTFIPCANLTMPNRSEATPRHIPLSFINRITEIRDIAANQGIALMLSGGTALGWYRECSFIAHAHDVDLMMLRSDHSEAFLDELKVNPNFPLERRFGRLRDSMEYTFCTEGINVDLFYLYPEGDRVYLTGMKYPPQQYRFYYPALKGVCAADLLNRLVYVPCNPLDFIQADYGSDWSHEVQSTNYTWYKSPLNVVERELYAQDEIPSVYYVRNVPGCNIDDHIITDPVVHSAQ